MTVVYCCQIPPECTTRKAFSFVQITPPSCKSLKRNFEASLRETNGNVCIMVMQYWCGENMKSLRVNFHIVTGKESDGLMKSKKIRKIILVYLVTKLVKYIHFVDIRLCKITGMVLYVCTASLYILYADCCRAHVWLCGYDLHVGYTRTKYTGPSIALPVLKL